MPIEGPRQPVISPTAPTISPTTGPLVTNTSTTLPSARLDLQTDRFELGASSTSPTPSLAVKERVDSSMNSFNSRLRRILHHDAASLAEGHQPVRDNAALSDAQRKELQDATKDFLLDLPIGSLSPTATSELRQFLDRQGVSTDGLETKSLKDLGDVGGELAKKWASDLKDSSPAAYYGLLATAGAAVGAYGYLNGSDALKKLGIKPEFKTKLFDDQIKIRAEATWEKRFRNPNLVADVEGNVNFTTTSLLFRSHIDARNLGSSNGDLGARFGNADNHLEAGVHANATDGITGYHVAGRLTTDRLTAHGRATFDHRLSFTGAELGLDARISDHTHTTLNLNIDEHARPSSIEGSLRYNTDRFSLSADARHDFVRDHTSVNVSAGYTPTNNLEFAVRGGYDTQRGTNVGVGVTWHF